MIVRTRVCIAVSVALATSLAIACGSFSGSDASPSVNGDGGGPADTAASTPDASASPLDASDARPFCANVDATFCSDFDTPGLTDPPFGWGVASTTPPQLDKDHVQSPPFSLHSATKAPTYVTLSKQFAVPDSIAVDFWVRFDPLLATGAGLYGPLTISQGGGNSFVFLYVNATEPYFQAGQKQYSYNDGGLILPAFGANTWHHVFVKVVMGSEARITASFDDVPAWKEYDLVDPWPSGSQVSVSVGVNPIYAVDGGSPLETWIDNVIIAVE